MEYGKLAKRDATRRGVFRGCSQKPRNRETPDAVHADWILDLGPEAGENGGQIVAEGPPEKIIQSKKSRTAPFLKAALRVS
jgi:hypothetical protein